MRILMASTAGSGHWRPVLPVLEALRDAGHDVTVCVPASVAQRVPAAGMTVRPFPDAPYPAPEQAALFARVEETGDASFAELAIGLGFSYFSPMAALPALTAAFDEVRPELVVCDPGEFGSRTLAEQRGLPWVMVHNGQASSFVGYEQIVVDGRRRLRAELGMPEDRWDDPTLLVTRTPASFEHGEQGGAWAAPTLRFRSGPTLTPPPDGPVRVYATIGTEALETPWGGRALATYAAGLGALAADGVHATITTGRELPEPLHTAENVDVRVFADHREVLPAASLVVTHGGSGTVTDAVTAGRPMVVTPLFADQFINGTAVVAFGNGTQLVGEELTPDAIADAVRATLDSDAPARARALAAEVAELPTPEELLPDLLAAAG